MKNSSNLVIKSKEKELATWKTRIEIANKFAEDNFRIHARRWVRMYRGEHFPQVYSRHDRIVVNYIYSIIKAILPQIYYQDPYVYITANNSIFADKQEVVEDVLNAYLRKMKIKKQVKRIILDALVCGFGVGKLGYCTDFKKVENPNLATNLEHTEFIEKEYPYFIRQSPFDMIFDFEARCFDEVRWIGARYYLPVDELKKSEFIKYENIDDIKGSYQAIDEQTQKKLMTLSDYSQSDLKRVEVWEIQDLVENKIYTICNEVDKFLRYQDNPYNLEGANYKILYFNDSIDNIFPISEITNLEDLNLELDKTRTQLLNHRAKSQRKILYESDAFESEEEKQKYLSGEDMQMVELSPGAIREGKIMIASASMVQPELYNICDMILFDMNNISRCGFNQRAVEARTEKTATEASIIEKNANLGNSERIDVVTDYLEDIARDLLRILQDFVSKEQEMFIDRKGQWLKFTNKDLAGDYSVKIEVGSTVRRDAEYDKQQAIQLFGLLTNLTDDNGKLLVNRKVLAEKLMKKFGLSQKEIDEIFAKEETSQEKITSITPEELAPYLTQAGGTQELTPEEITSPEEVGIY